MELMINIFPNFADEQPESVAFAVTFSEGGSDDPPVDKFDVRISGNIPGVDSVVKLREMAKAKALAILQHLAEAI